MKERHVVIVAFDGVQPLDAVGPHEVFAGAGRAASSVGRAGGYRVTLASSAGGPVRAESGLRLGTALLPGEDERIDTLVLAGGSGANAAAADETLVA
jgi:putative intracellular protease/amidase